MWPVLTTWVGGSVEDIEKRMTLTMAKIAGLTTSGVMLVCLEITGLSSIQL